MKDEIVAFINRLKGREDLSDEDKTAVSELETHLATEESKQTTEDTTDTSSRNEKVEKIPAKQTVNPPDNQRQALTVEMVEAMSFEEINEMYNDEAGRKQLAALARQ